MNLSSGLDDATRLHSLILTRYFCSSEHSSHIIKLKPLNSPLPSAHNGMNCVHANLDPIQRSFHILWRQTIHLFLTPSVTHLYLSGTASLPPVAIPSSHFWAYNARLCLRHSELIPDVVSAETFLVSRILTDNSVSCSPYRYLKLKLGTPFFEPSPSGNGSSASLGGTVVVTVKLLLCSFDQPDSSVKVASASLIYHICSCRRSYYDQNPQHLSGGLLYHLLLGASLDMARTLRTELPDSHFSSLLNNLYRHSRLSIPASIFSSWNTPRPPLPTPPTPRPPLPSPPILSPPPVQASSAGSQAPVPNPPPPTSVIPSSPSGTIPSNK